MPFENKPIGFRPYKEFRDVFNNEKVYTRREMSEALKQQAAEYEKRDVINRVVMIGQHCDIAMRIDKVVRTPDGTIVYVR